MKKKQKQKLKKVIISCAVAAALAGAGYMVFQKIKDMLVARAVTNTATKAVKRSMRR